MRLIGVLDADLVAAFSALERGLVGLDGGTIVVDVHDLHATILHQMGVDHTKLTYRFQGRDFRLTDVSGEVVRKMLA